MSDYFEKTFVYPGDESIVLNSSPEESPRHYDIGTYVGHTAEYITVSAKQLHELADFIKENVPEPSLLEDAVFIKAVHVRFADTRSLAKVGSYWFDTDGKAYTEDEVLRYYTRMEIIV